MYVCVCVCVWCRREVGGGLRQTDIMIVREEEISDGGEEKTE